MKFHTGSELLEVCEKEQCHIGDVMLRRELEVSGQKAEHVRARMERALEIMQDAVRRAQTQKLHSMGGLIGGECRKMDAQRALRRPLCGGIVSKAAGYAMGVLEVNASMGLIVAAPTAGASGVLPGVLLALQEEFHFSKDSVLDALFNAGAVGYLISRNATVAGAEGGCQAEVGSAGAMAASAAVQLAGGTAEQCLNAASMALCNILGLVCDPVGGLVETPCQMRNAMGAANALISAEMALAGCCAPASFDEAVAAMYAVGQALPASLRETAQGGIAKAPSACARCAGGISPCEVVQND